MPDATMKILLTIGIIVIVTLAASSRRFWSMRRRPLLAAVSSGGWFVVAIGMLLGPVGVRFIEPQDLEVLSPIILFCLGWVGITIGLQINRQIWRQIPQKVIGFASADLLISLAVVASATALLLLCFGGSSLLKSSGALLFLFAISFAGWPSGVRSLRFGQTRPSQELSQIVRATAGVSSLLTVLCYGVLLKVLLFYSSTDNNIGNDPSLISGFLLSVSVALAVGAMGALLASLVGKNQGEVMAMLFGIVALASGSAVVMGLSPLFVSMLVGMFIALSSEYNADRFQRYIVEAERPFAMALLLVAGMSVDVEIGTIGLALIVVGVVGRIAAKSIVARSLARTVSDNNGERVAMLSALRQSPLSVVLILALTPQLGILTPTLSYPAAKLLSVVIVIGIISALLPIVLALVLKRKDLP